MKPKNKKIADVGVLIGRFQLHDLHEGHRRIINEVLKKHKKVIMCVGVSPALGCKKNPLDYLTREKMIRSYFPVPNLTVVPLVDCPTDEQWSKQLDDILASLCPINTIMLYGGRDSFIAYYKGKHKTEVLDFNIPANGTNIRYDVGREILNTPDFRAGVIYSTQNQFPRVFPTIDVAIYDSRTGRILLGHKNSDGEYLRFVGGFVDPADQSYEAAARREVYEETNLVVESDPVYIGSFLINDWRYRWEADKIMTTFFMVDYSWGKEEPGDDLDGLEWLHYSELEERIASGHKVLAKEFCKFILENKDKDGILNRKEK